MNTMIEAHNAVHGFEIIDGKIQPPKYDLPDFINERVEYFGKYSEEGMSFYGCLSAILAYDEEECKKQFQLGASGDWMPISAEVREWFDHMGTPGEMLITVKLLYGLRPTE
ncbi:hypothetical protein [Enterococcus pallens]|uniref:Phage protein n=1 Tax=Enterococcus pallens ATCC BAA-351 TaxID=1158607 RepID=R2SPT1_9ENTE|nr:hypothetical protein [Enterococcus pallens]EOH94816.1 hypothetical protein UAU_01738 [Enterococcus pallens ATCC BAA-351]EOH96371.1 hypothetical protein UAU_01021 [Enterococcus pallens ATCC BAA-351]EOU14416.1 hypothetical protein I588_04773 [Enterococcus pallens ATCC BAA-351]EOU14865.1 hypothetical protein I588_04515 [Enterococcus pallens ATCC BAA-351]OJG69736.1 hypothetical protein RV10_GL000736 [Enterococcus pallens]